MLRGVNARYLALAVVVLGLGYAGFLWLRGETSAPSLSPEEVQGLFLKKGCTNCHDIRNPLVGPSFEAIARRYQGDPDAEQKLFDSVRHGSQGKWYDPRTTTAYGIRRVMPAQDRKKLPDGELRAMVRWILRREWRITEGR